MSNTIIEIKIAEKCSSLGKPVVISIGEPEEDADSTDFYCAVSSLEENSFNINIFGVSQSQAVELAIRAATSQLLNIVHPSFKQ